MNTMLPTTEMERAYLERDASYNGLFFLGVRSTGIFCRPTCPARKPLPKNVEYFANARRPGSRLPPVQALPTTCVGRSAPLGRRPTCPGGEQSFGAHHGKRTQGTRN